MDNALIFPQVSAELSAKPPLKRSAALPPRSRSLSPKTCFDSTKRPEGLEPTPASNMPENSRRNSGFFRPNRQNRCQQNCQQIVAPESSEIISILAGLLWRNVLNSLQIRSLEGQILPPQPLPKISMIYMVYVLRNADGQFYIGLSADIHLRLEQHNQGISKWTRGKGPWSLVWTSEATSLSGARKLENLLKRQKAAPGSTNSLASLVRLKIPRLRDRRFKSYPRNHFLCGSCRATCDKK